MEYWQFHAYLFPKPSPEAPQLSNDLGNLFVEALLGLSFTGGWGTRTRTRYTIRIKEVHVGGAGVLSSMSLTPKLSNSKHFKVCNSQGTTKRNRTPN